MVKFAGKEIGEFTLTNAAKAVKANPKGDYTEVFAVHGEYGNVAHGHLDVKREGCLPDVDEIGVMAYENLLLDAIRCTGTDYLEVCAALGIDVDAVALDVVGEADIAGSLAPFGVKSRAPAGWRSITFRATVRTNASKAAVAKAHRRVWETNLAAATLNAPVTFEVAVEPIPAKPAKLERTVRARA